MSRLHPAGPSEIRDARRGRMGALTARPCTGDLAPAKGPGAIEEGTCSLSCCATAGSSEGDAELRIQPIGKLDQKHVLRRGVEDGPEIPIEIEVPVPGVVFAPLLPDDKQR